MAIFFAHKYFVWVSEIPTFARVSESDRYWINFPLCNCAYFIVSNVHYCNSFLPPAEQCRINWTMAKMFYYSVYCPRSFCEVLFEKYLFHLSHTASIHLTIETLYSSFTRSFICRRSISRFLSRFLIQFYSVLIDRVFLVFFSSFFIYDDTYKVNFTFIFILKSYHSFYWRFLMTQGGTYFKNYEKRNITPFLDMKKSTFARKKSIEISEWTLIWLKYWMIVWALSSTKMTQVTEG